MKYFYKVINCVCWNCYNDITVNLDTIKKAKEYLIVHEGWTYKDKNLICNECSEELNSN